MESENADLINNFSDEYVQSFLDNDFSELLNESADKVAINETDVVETNTSINQDSSTENTVDEQDDISDDFDIDALIDEVHQSSDTQEDMPLDIGDDLLDTELLDSELISEGSDEQTAEDTTDFIDDDTLAGLSNEFDESTLAQLLDDEKDDDYSTDLAPDFNDSNVLADLLTEDSEKKDLASTEGNDKNNAEEVDGIKALDNVDFDDLLANIEEESSSSSSDESELDENFEIGDDFEIEALDDDVELVDDLKNEESAEKNFISVDALLSDSLDNAKPTEPYEKMGIDGGLGEFPEFSGNITGEDIDDDDNGIAAKFDLANVYLEIGDHENAEVILLDVVNKGDAEQQSKAQKLLDNLK